MSEYNEQEHSDSLMSIDLLHCLHIILFIAYFCRLLRWTYPHLHAHFTAIELSPEVITAQWFLTLFTYTFPVVPTVLELWDYIFLSGWEGVCRIYGF